MHDHNMDADYALKLLDPTQVLGPWDEARLLNSLRGDFILPIRNADTTPDGTRFLVTDVAERGTLAAMIDPTLGVPEHLAVGWVRDACNGLARVHRHGLLHRDVKPENLFITESARCVVGDLSLAGLRGASGCAAAAGTVETMAPEIGAVGVPGYAGPTEVYSVRSEVFSLGATLYWLLTGRPAITGTRYRDAATASPVDLWELAPHVSRATRDITTRAIAPDPGTRYPDPASLAAALGRSSQPDRRWTRVAPHTGHERCYLGVKSGRAIRLCVIPRADSRGYVIQVRHDHSGRRHGQDGITTSASQLNRTIRATVRAIG